MQQYRDIETVGFEIVRIAHQAQTEPGNIREYRYGCVMFVDWRDDHCAPGKAIRETFVGYAASPFTAEHDVQVEFRRWVNRMNQIDSPFARRPVGSNGSEVMEAS